MLSPPPRQSDARPGAVAEAGAPSLHEECVPGRLCPECYRRMMRERAREDLRAWLEAWDRAGGRSVGRA